MKPLNNSSYDEENPIARSARLEAIQEAGCNEYLARGIEEIQKKFGLDITPSSSFDEVMEQARARLNRNFEAYLASLSSRNLENLKGVQARLEEFKELMEYLGARYNDLVDLINSRIRRRASASLKEAAMIQK
ncbi:MAG: hypothetical protein UR28_C0026G0002 [Candidatus Peregrinibacteria bacterium GW2011_GWF2_33_10]|nr:MAG: hypothetical protein UR28_C0026G0002 [Candidatus Peregrinibacteria bacterium GW2011_GWF2_33_10]OGJ45452.1 MAG: hypothetical protein A2272_06880 [Candidatus Peregrinibacteria bacterium RIFOXYA12_FULL_33_12]OGJ50067.1 MAG: hypothetical protein A2307_01545 [Candidatus Peregrinibacteria bacterium RIFOXYB2_FULL_33_20]